ncbi:hypothetical protein NFI95_02950 [Acetobacteraceae bacterium KSS8]|uniref:Glycine zipper 2TM domain-containing protein n=1 Tax=Endosaccharibacter trunci TaxID=2812733 RepID=A0ABT1W3G8_9PROT|nr:hypothetical protein [Acetobacteraceae bacterium KSS8]
MPIKRSPARAGLALLLGIAVLPAAPALAEPGGCLKYGAVGAVGGHVAHHGVLGAAGGCVTGMYVRHEYRKKERKDAAAYRAEHANDGRMPPSAAVPPPAADSPQH